MSWFGRTIQSKVGTIDLTDANKVENEEEDLTRYTLKIIDEKPDSFDNLIVRDKGGEVGFYTIYTRRKMADDNK